MQAAQTGHPLGARPFTRADYVAKLRMLAAGIVEDAELDRFLAAVEQLPDLPAGSLGRLNIVARPGLLDAAGAPQGLL